MRLVFMGTPAFAVPTLAALVAAGHDIAAVYTRAPKPAGRRGLALTPSPVQAFADARGLPVATPRGLRDEAAAAALAAYGAEMAVVVGYGVILPPAILAVPKLGCLNLHPSALPRWRGAAPIQRPIMAGEAATAVAVMRMDEGLDTGPVALTELVAIPPEATAGDLHDILAARGAALMADAVARAAAGTLRFVAQATDGIAYAAKIDKAEARLDWAEPAATLHDKVRGLSPFPGAWFEADCGRGPERIKLLRSRRADGRGPAGTVLDAMGTIACGTGALQLVEVQRAGRAPMAADAFLRGTALVPGATLPPVSLTPAPCPASS